MGKINSNGKNCFAFRTIHFSNSLLERIMFDNRGLTVPKMCPTVCVGVNTLRARAVPVIPKKNTISCSDIFRFYCHRH